MTPPRAAAAPVAAPASLPSKHSIIRLIHRVRIELIDAMDRDLSKFDITAAQLMVLAFVANKEADSAATLCKSISYDPGAMTRMIDRLEQKEFVSSMLGDTTPARGGRAKRYFRVTPKGLREAKTTKRALISLWRGIPQLEGERA
jgi:DNA-binding MarR family transcriptional regulator